MSRSDNGEGARKSVSFITLGCAKNEADTRSMSAKLASAGFRIVADTEDADAVIVNTCSFIRSATEESLDAIFDLADDPGLQERQVPLIIAGCMPARYGDELEDELTEAAAFVPCSHEDDIVAIVEGCIGPSCSDREAIDDELVSMDQPSEGSAQLYSYVKISDGCDRWCSYCTIPLIRGRYHSFPHESIRAEVLSEISRGAREIVLIAQDTGRWGSDLEDPRSLADLLGSLAREFPETLFRVMYIQPEGISDDLLDVIAEHDNICSYLDIPLQHVNETILRAMNRRGSKSEFESLIARIKDRVPDITLRTTLIAGFPGESDEAFSELEDFVSQGLFDYVGVFPYSREEGTVAADLPDQIDEEEKAYRAQRIRDIADAVSSSRFGELIGKEARILIEGIEEDGQLYGRATFQAPEVDGIAFVDKGRIGDIVNVRVSDTLLYDIEGEAL